jgi:hypothetical protein
MHSQGWGQCLSVSMQRVRGSFQANCVPQCDGSCDQDESTSAVLPQNSKFYVSSDYTATTLPSLTALISAMLMAQAALPMLSLAAMMSSEFWRTLVIIICLSNFCR